MLTDATLLTVEITVANDVRIGTSYDGDIMYGVSDGSKFVGWHVPDKGNYGTHSPCYGVECASGVTDSKLKAFRP